MLKEKSRRSSPQRLFATVREASVRAIGQRHFDVQPIGGNALHMGTIAEMKTRKVRRLSPPCWLP